MSTEITALIASVVLAGLACFQALLALKLPLGKAAWGGKWTVLPPGFRIASTVSGILLIFALLCVLERGGVATIFGNDGLVFWVTWILTVFFLLYTLTNYFSLSRTEKRIMTPLSFFQFILLLFVSTTAG